MLTLSRRVNESLDFYVGDEKVRITVIRCGDRQVRFSMEASKAVKISRSELDNREENDSNSG